MGAGKNKQSGLVNRNSIPTHASDAVAFLRFREAYLTQAGESNGEWGWRHVTLYNNRNDNEGPQYHVRGTRYGKGASIDLWAWMPNTHEMFFLRDGGWEKPMPVHKIDFSSWTTSVEGLWHGNVSDGRFEEMEENVRNLPDIAKVC